MATILREKEPYERLVGMASAKPEASPTKRVGTEAPVGAVTAGPSAGKSAAEFTQTSKASPGSVFNRQLGGANIAGITRLAEQPLLREFGQEARRIAGEGLQYKQQTGERLAKEPQFQFQAKDKEGKPIDQTADIVGRIAAGGEDYGTAQEILGREKIEIPEFSTAPVKEFTPMQALRGGTVESLLRKEATGPYSTGMAGLDALLFAKKGGAGQLAERGTALRTAGQTAADILQGKARGIIPETIKGQLEAAGLQDVGDLSAEARQQAEQLVKGQKEQLEAGLKGGITAREEAYTKAGEGKKSKLQEAQEKLVREYGERYGETAKARQADIEKRIEGLKSQALENMIRKLSAESIAAQEAAGRDVQGDVTINIPTRAELLQAAQNDPRYQHALKNIELQAPYAQQRGQMIQGNIPTLGLQNVITEQDAAQYNRLQQLLGGKAITPTQATFGQPSYDVPDLERFFRNLGQFTNV